jgi:hypothetical protein
MSSEHVHVQKRRDRHAYIGEDASGMAKDNGRQENPDTTAKEEEAEEIAEAQ